MLEEIPLILRIVAATIAVIGTPIAVMASWQKFRTWQKRRLLVESEYTEKFLGQFNKKEIDSFLAGYIIPKCSPTDPTNREGEGFLADIRQPIFEYMDRNIDAVERSFHIILADTGMGKTMFCINYFAHLRKNFPRLNVCLTSLSSSNCEQQIAKVVNKAETILIADAFDEDPKGFGRGRDRLIDILEMASDFKLVIITCRSQFFISDDAIPRETPLPILIPRQLGQSPTFSLIRSYISPFSKKEVDRYLRKHFPFWAFWRLEARRRSTDLIESVPDLVHRPMLLERLPELAKTPSNTKEIYDLYDLLVTGWLERESRWIKFSELKSISSELALIIYSQMQSRQGRIGRDEVVQIATDLHGSSPDWQHLTSRSLLNRDSRGNFKFAHKSILEFLVVKATAEGDDRGLRFPWTPFMKELFISWGYTEEGTLNSKRAKEILASEEGRKSIAPLFDMHGTTAVHGIPNFKRALERKFTSTGDRFSPANWREYSIGVNTSSDNSVYYIHDHEFNLEWIYHPTSNSDELPPMTLLDALKSDSTDAGNKLPSLEQFLTLVEGLYYSQRNILKDGSMFLLADKPAKHVHLLVQLNSEPLYGQHYKIVERLKTLSGTSVQVNCYVSGTPYGSDYANKVIVDHLRIKDVFSNQLL